MHDGRDQHTQPRDRARLVERLDALVETGRVTEAEAERLRAADTSNDFDDAVREIRLRHATARLDDVVEDRHLSREEADAFLARVGNGEHPPIPRDLRRRARWRDRPSPTTRDRGDAHG